jgi:hypothetical protein
MFPTLSHLLDYLFGFNIPPIQTFTCRFSFFMAGYWSFSQGIKA